MARRDRPRFGTAVDLHGSTAVVGTPPAMTAGPQLGAAQVYDLDGGSLSATATLTPAPDTIGGDFGTTTAVGEDLLMVGAPLPGVPGGPHGGAVSVFTPEDGEWSHRWTVTAPETRGVDRFGASLAVDGSSGIVGAPGATAGRATLLEHRRGRLARQVLTSARDTETMFGRAVARSHRRAVVGARDTETGAGVAALYRRAGDRWNRETTVASWRDGLDDGFGAALALEDGVLVVGAPTESTDNGDQAGAAYVFTETAGRWLPRARLRDPAAQPRGAFGRAVAIDDGTVLVAADDTATVFTPTSAGWQPTHSLGGPSMGTVGGVALDAGAALLGGAGGGAGGRVEVFGP